MGTPDYNEMYVGVSADNELVVGIYCDQCGKAIYEGVTINVTEILDRTAWHRLQHERGEV